MRNPILKAEVSSLTVKAGRSTSRLSSVRPAASSFDQSWDADRWKNRRSRTDVCRMSTRLGGICWIPKALRSSCSTTTSLTNEVAMIATNGASDSATSSAIRTVGSLKLICMGEYLADKDTQARADLHEPPGRKAKAVGTD